MEYAYKFVEKAIELKQNHPSLRILFGAYVAFLGYKNIIEPNYDRTSMVKMIKDISSRTQSSKKEILISIIKIGLLVLLYQFGFRILKRKIKSRKHKQQKLKAKALKQKSYTKIQSFQMPQFEDDLFQKVLNASAHEIKQFIINGEISAVQALQIFIKQTQDRGIELELVTENNFEYALKLANEIDQQRKTMTKEQMQAKPLFGVPISVKDSFMIKGLISTAGLINNLDYKAENNSKVIQLIIQAGGIPFIKSNVPQLMMTIESVNYIWGRSKNPWDTTRTTGGSSGGEAGLIAARCSPLGLGTDIGSSIRQPAAYCGIMGLKPSSGRISQQGYMVQKIKELQLMPHIMKSSIGPMGKSVEDLALLMQAMLDKEQWDLLPKKTYPQEFFHQNTPFNLKEYNKEYKKLKIGYFLTIDSCFPASLANQRAVIEAVQALQKLGHECQLIKIPNIENIVYQLILALGPDGFYQLNKYKNIEPIIEEYQVSLEYQKKRKESGNDFMTQQGEYCNYDEIEDSIDKKEMPMWDSYTKLSAAQYKMLSYQVQKSKILFYSWFSQNKYDAILCPTTGLPAIKHGTSQPLIGNTIYSGIFNLLDVPSGQLPITTIRKDEQQIHNINKLQHLKDKINDCLEGSEGLPVGIQVICLNKQEEKVLNIMRIIEKEIKFYEKFSLQENANKRVHECGSLSSSDVYM